MLSMRLNSIKVVLLVMVPILFVYGSMNASGLQLKLGFKFGTKAPLHYIVVVVPQEKIELGRYVQLAQETIAEEKSTTGSEDGSDHLTHRYAAVHPDWITLNAHAVYMARKTAIRNREPIVVHPSEAMLHDNSQLQGDTHFYDAKNEQKLLFSIQQAELYALLNSTAKNYLEGGTGKEKEAKDATEKIGIEEMRIDIPAKFYLESLLA